MTTYVPFIPPNNAPQIFLATLDGVQYSLSITWNLFGQRWYLNVYTLRGVLRLSLARVSSPDDGDINLLRGFFKTSSLVFRDSTQSIEINP